MQIVTSGFEEVLVYFVGGILFIAGGLFTSWLLRPQRPNVEKLSTYESGEEAIGSAWGQFNIRFFVILLVFLLFEVELVFLFPWATVFADKNLMYITDGTWGMLSFGEMSLFVGVLALGLAYVWRKGHLSWEKPQTNTSRIKSKIPIHKYHEINNKYKNSNCSSV